MNLWSDASPAYGLLVHSCFVDDGNGRKFELLDDRGFASLFPAYHRINEAPKIETDLLKYLQMQFGRRSYPSNLL